MNCAKCGKEIPLQQKFWGQETPQPLPKGVTEFEALQYHDECIEDKLDTFDLRENPILDIGSFQLKASEAFALVKTLNSVEATTVPQATGISKLRSRLITPLAEHNNYYVRCWNENCESGILRLREAFEGVATPAAVKEAKHDTLLLQRYALRQAKKPGFSKGRHVFHFCNPKCDVMIASRIRLDQEKEQARKDKIKAAAKDRKKSEDSGLNVMILQLLALSKKVTEEEFAQMYKSVGMTKEDVDKALAAVSKK